MVCAEALVDRQRLSVPGFARKAVRFGTTVGSE